MSISNFCIDKKENLSPKPNKKDLRMVRGNQAVRYKLNGCDIELDEEIVRFTSNGSPLSLLHRGHHFRDSPQGWRPVSINNENVPRDVLISIIEKNNYRRPPIK